MLLTPRATTPLSNHQVRTTQERILHSLQQASNNERHAERERKMAEKYRMVKFFEKRKCLRALKKAKAALLAAGESDSAVRTAASASVLKSENDLKYIQYYPKHLKYISIIKDDISPEGPQIISPRALAPFPCSLR